MLALGPSGTGNVVSGRSGVFPGGTAGTGLSVRCQVTPAGGMTIAVNGGQYCVDRGIAIGLFLGSVNGTVTVDHTSSSPTNPRIDYVIIRTRDPGIDSNVTESAKVVILPGTPAPVPTEPTGQLTSGDLLLAAVTIRAGTVVITTSDIADRRVFVTTRGGITPYDPTVGVPAGAYEGQYFDNMTTKALERWSGSALSPVASPAEWSQLTPLLYSGGDGDGDVSGTVVCNLGTGAVSSCRYHILGKHLEIQYSFIWGTAPYNAGAGAINTFLPPGCVFPSNGLGECLLITTLSIPGDASVGAGNYIGACAVRPGSNRVWPGMPLSHSDCRYGYYIVARQAGVPGAGTPLVTGGYPEGGTLFVTGSIEIE